MENIKGYLLVIVSGVVLFAAVVFTSLQWGVWSTISAFGPEQSVRTIYLVSASAAGGVLVYWMCRMMFRGVGILWKIRRRQQRILSEVRKAEKDSSPAQD